MAWSLAVASGKGGVGKTSMAVNLGLTFARLGQRVTLLDADFGMANSHILLGINPLGSVADVMAGRAGLEQSLSAAPLGMRFLSGGSGLLEVLNLDSKARYQMIRSMEALESSTDILITDVPAGASDSSVAFVGAADRVLVVLVGEPTSFLDAYALIKAAHLEAGVQRFSVLVNMAQSAEQARSHYDKFQMTVSRFLDVQLEFAGHMPMSALLRKSIASRKPIALEDKNLRENIALQNIAKSVMRSPLNEVAGIRYFSSGSALKGAG